MPLGWRHQNLFFVHLLGDELGDVNKRVLAVGERRPHRSETEPVNTAGSIELSLATRTCREVLRRTYHWSAR